MSGPLVGEKLMARVAFKTVDREGYTPNLYTSIALDNADSTSVRASIRFDPTDTIRFDLIGEHGINNDSPARVMSRGRSTLPFDLITAPFFTDRKINQNDTGPNDKKFSSLTGRLIWDFDGATMTSLTGYRELHWLVTTELDMLPITRAYIDRDKRDQYQVSQELYVSSNTESNLQWIAGAYYFRDKETDEGRYILIDYPIPGDNWAHFHGDDYTVESWATYAEASYRFFDRMTLTVGGRYTWEEKSVAGGTEYSWLGGRGVYQSLSAKWENFSPKAAVSYDFSDTIIGYGTVSRGFKAGGYNGASGQNPNGHYDPEYVTNYELGLKSELLESRLRMNVAGFFMDYEDLLVTVLIYDPRTQILTSNEANAASSEIYGVEYDVQALLTKALYLNLAVAWLDATFDSYPNAPDPNDPTGQSIVDVSGNRLRNSPEWTLNLGADYTLDVGNWGSATLHGDYAYRSKVYYNVYEDDFTSQEGYGLFNARLTFSGYDKKWNIALWMSNITDEEVTTYRSAGTAGISPTGIYFDYLRPPRTYGVTIGYNF